jgi:hypothetical protein
MRPSVPESVGRERGDTAAGQLQVADLEALHVIYTQMNRITKLPLKSLQFSSHIQYFKTSVHEVNFQVYLAFKRSGS